MTIFPSEFLAHVPAALRGSHRWRDIPSGLLLAAVVGPLALSGVAQAAPPGSLVATPAPPTFTGEATGGAVQRIDDYAAATAAARQSQSMLLVSVEPTGGDPADAVMVGDSETDSLTAQAAGIPCILVTFGYTEKPVRELGATALIDHYRDLPAALARCARA